MLGKDTILQMYGEELKFFSRIPYYLRMFGAFLPMKTSKSALPKWRFLLTNSVAYKDNYSADSNLKLRMIAAFLKGKLP
jgi:hypothetical protein